jgi:hypothetical protein
MATSLLAKELRSLADKTGVIHPRAVLDWARKHKRSAIGKRLDWDDRSAAEKYRLQQIRYLIEIYVVDPYGGREFLSLSIDRPQGGGYRPVGQIQSRPELREILLNDAVDDLERLQRLYRTLPELRPVWTLVASLRRRSGRKDDAA